MIAGKHIHGIVIAAVAVAAVVILLAVAILDTGVTGVKMAYETTLFDTAQIASVNILMDAAAWQDLLKSAASETYYTCDVEINGVRVNNAGVRAKGNTSLMSVAASDSDRYSLKIQFDEYIKGQTYQGLDKLVLNNHYADATMMKEALAYDLFAYLDVPASLYNYAQVMVNGEYIGVYLALEDVEESFALRNYGVQFGKLYKPDTMEMNQSNQELGMKVPDTAAAAPGAAGRGPGAGFAIANMTEEEREAMKKQFQMPNRDTPFQGREGGGGFGGFGGSGATSLNYIDDALESYQAIWDSSVFASGKSDHRRVVEALKNISAGEKLEESMNVDHVLKYLAVHTFMVNMDSLSSTMAHNYYLYEKNGQLDIIPWDYNLSLGGQSFSGSVSLVNFPIDTPFSGVDMEDRKFFMSLLNVEAYQERYHQYLTRITQEYVYGGEFDAFYERVRGQVDGLVEMDPTSFYPYAQYKAAADMLYHAIGLRADSVSGQLAGTIPSTTQGQAEHPEQLVDESSMDASVMGSMRDGQDRGGFGGMNGGNPDFPGGENEQGQPPDMPQGFNTGALSGNAPGGTQEPAATGELRKPRGIADSSASAMTANGIWLIACFAAMLIATVFVGRFKRR